MPLTLQPLFKYCAVKEESPCLAVVDPYYAGKMVLANDVVRFGLNNPVTQVTIQRGDKLRATRMFPHLFAIQNNDGTSYYFRVPIGYNGEINTPLETRTITDPTEHNRILYYLNGQGIKISSFGNDRTIDVPPDFSKDKHNFSASDYWLRQNGITPR